MLITAAQATSMANAVNGGGYIDPLLIDERNETGNLVIDELDHAATWAARSGLYNAYLDISKFPMAAVNNAISILQSVGYVVDKSRLESYKEILFSWS